MKSDIFEEVQTARKYSHYEVKFLGLILTQARSTTVNHRLDPISQALQVANL